MRRTARRPRHAAVLLSLVAITAGLLLTTGPLVLAADDGAAGQGLTAIDAPPIQRRGTIDVSSLAQADPADLEAVEAPSFPSPFGAHPGSVNGAGRTLAAGPAPVEATTNGQPPAGQPGWDGFEYLDTGFQPPDPWVAVGPDHVVQTVNSSIQIWDREGGVELTPTLLSVAELFDLPAGFENFDPRVIYDSLHGRWIATEVSLICQLDGEGPFGFLDILVSRTADPTGVWDLYFYATPGRLPDYPAPGTSTNKVAFTMNMFELVDSPDCTDGATYQETELWIVDWTDLLEPGGPDDGDTLAFTWSDPIFGTEAYFTARAALQTPATSSTLYVVTQRFDPGTGDLTPWYSAITGSASPNTIDFPVDRDLSSDLGLVGDMFDPPFPVQPGGSQITPLIDSRPTDAIWQNGRLTFVSTNGCTPAGDTEERACVRVTQLATPSIATSPPTKVQDFLIAEDGAHHYFGGIGQAGDGSLHVVWTRSADETDGEPSSYTAYQTPGDSVDSLSAPELLAQGSGTAFTGGRWGDYTGVAQDPQVPNAVWQGGMYSDGGLNWATNVSKLQTGGSTYVPIEPERVLSSRDGIGLSGTFKANIARTFDVAGVAPIPADAVAVTGNVTVTDQTAAGYVSITTTPTSTPGSSSINFPVGDVRANNVTAPLSASGTLSAVYKASSGKTANVIFDVTGYFLAGDDDAVYNTLAAPVRVLDSRSGKDIGLTGRFLTGIPRELEIADGSSGVPAEAVAVTANLTVTGQTKGGYVSITPTEDATPSSSTLNFPVGDTRANGLTAKLDLDADSLWLVYKAAPGSTTDLILDITGYYIGSGAGLRFFPLNPGRIMDSRTSVLSGITGRFDDEVSRTLDTDGHWGVPEGAQAVTGNLTVTGQTGGGYVSITPDPPVFPLTTSTINFPNGDTRANGVTVGLSADGDMRLTYNGSAGRSTHLILDVTGYFVPSS